MPFIAIAVWVIVMFITYIIIRSAIDNSEAVVLLREIRDLLKKQDMKGRAIDISQVNEVSGEEEVGE